MKSPLLVILVISFLANLIFAQFLFFSKRDSGTEKNVRQERDQYPYLSRRIFIENQNDLLLNFVDLRAQIQTYHKGVDDDFGVYFEYLPTGVSIGVNEKENFVLASLLKVPLVMGIYKRIENGELKKTDELAIKESDQDPFFGNLWRRGVGTKLSVEELIRLTLTESDNTAQRMLLSNSEDAVLENVFDSLDIPKDLENNRPVVTPKNYSSVLRSLYLSSYLTRQDSSEILELLTATNFNDKLVAGVPQNIKVAHKIGVQLEQDRQLSVFTDCGIVYVPLRPYILCLMSRSSEAEAQTYMRDVSKMVFDYVKNTNIGPSPND